MHHLAYTLIVYIPRILMPHSFLVWCFFSINLHLWLNLWSDAWHLMDFVNLLPQWYIFFSTIFNFLSSILFSSQLLDKHVWSIVAAMLGCWQNPRKCKLFFTHPCGLRGANLRGCPQEIEMPWQMAFLTENLRAVIALVKRRRKRLFNSRVVGMTRMSSPTCVAEERFIPRRETRAINHPSF